uniref:Uncharacterized protein n=1 Tax=Ditylum brightwellii TaxID=49249 RepID=A0A6V2K5Q1_9STRA|mmetsp:Transcript_26678/g.39324  ORF Transcript_26678/g.39324 Transcript_26678/m.39324 type:complete len:105 (-) Transcript_26678:348-662(-)
MRRPRPGNLGNGFGKVGPQSATQARGHEGEVVAATGGGAQLFPRFRGPRSRTRQNSKAADDEWHRRHASDASKELVLPTGHHGSHGLVGSDRREQGRRPRGSGG